MANNIADFCVYNDILIFSLIFSYAKEIKVNTPRKKEKEIVKHVAEKERINKETNPEVIS